MPTVGAPGTGIASAVYTILTIGALLQKTLNNVRLRLGGNRTSVVIPLWLFSDNISL